MDKNEFIDLLCGSNLPTEDKIKELKEIIRQHPYSALPHFILAKFYYYINHPEKEIYLQLASAYATDRKILKQFIQKEYVMQESGKENILFERHTNSPIDIEAGDNFYASDPEVKEETEIDIFASTTHDSDELILSDNNIGDRESIDYKIQDVESREEAHLHLAAENNSEALSQEVNDNLEQLRILKSQWLASEEANKKEVRPDYQEDINHHYRKIKETEETYMEEVSESYIESELFNEESESVEDLSVAEMHETEDASNSVAPPENGHEKIKLSEEQTPENEAINEYEEKEESSLLLDYLTRINTEKESGEELEDNYRIHQNELIERFIKYTPSLHRASLNDKNIENQEDLSERSITSDSDLVSENLAVIMTKQGKIEKAIDIYKKLIWKYPQKKVYFASRIEELKK